MATNKQQHYVPQFYLRGFAPAGERCVRAYNIKSRRHIPRATIRGQCHRAYFYGPDRSPLDEVLTDVERAAAPILHAMLRDERLPTTDRAFIDFATFVLVQWARTPTAARRRNLWMTKYMRAFVRSHPGAPADVKDNLHLVEMTDPDAVASGTIQAFDWVPTILDLHLKLIRNESREEFVTSDAPVVLHNQWQQGITVTSTVGFTSSGLQIFLPLTPSHVACLYDPEVYRLGPRLAGVVATADHRFVRQVNALQMAHAEENLYYLSAETAARIDALPWAQRANRDDEVASVRYAPSDQPNIPVGDLRPRKELIVTYRRGASIGLSSSVFQIHRKLATLPMNERAGRRREIAGRISDALGPKEEHPGSGSPPGTSFRVIDTV